MSRPARQRRKRLWSIIVLVVVIVFALAFLSAWFFVPGWLAPWWGFMLIPLFIVLVIVMRRIERWWWSHSPWAWREVI